jgi:hypothetical protein
VQGGSQQGGEGERDGEGDGEEVEWGGVGFMYNEKATGRLREAFGPNEDSGGMHGFRLAPIGSWLVIGQRGATADAYGNVSR